MGLQEKIAQVKQAAPLLAATSLEQRNKALAAAAKALETKKETIFKANKEDLKNAKENHIPEPILNRLKFDEGKLSDIISGIHDLIQMPDPLFQTQLARQLDEGLNLYRETCPIGVIGVIFESRPDALVQISALCIKSGNCAILKGGSEAMESNRILFQTIHEAVINAGLPRNCMLQLEARSDIAELLECHESVDLLIPRGSNAFVRYIIDNTKIPVMGHADGICHIYVDKDADIEKSIPIIIDSKTQYVSACNAAETLLVHKEIAKKLLPALQKAFHEKHVELRGSKEVQDIIACNPSSEEDDHTEYLDYIISIKIVNDMDEAIRHINHFGSHHTDCILTEDNQAAHKFMQLVDSAGVYQNCSTRFADGYRYGFGAEVGISTSKLHARGPVGLEGLLSYKYKLFGNGQIVGDYATGKKSFHFKNL